MTDLYHLIKVQTIFDHLKITEKNKEVERFRNSSTQLTNS